MKHTPGPWFIWGEGIYAGNPRKKSRNELSGHEGQICEMDDLDFTARARKANARLIAAAPELLALLIESQDSIGGDWRKRRDALIAKATGEQL